METAILGQNLCPCLAAVLHPGSPAVDAAGPVGFGARRLDPAITKTATLHQRLAAPARHSVNECVRAPQTRGECRAGAASLSFKGPTLRACTSPLQPPSYPASFC